MDMKAALLAIGEITGKTYGEAKDGQVTKIASGEVIPADHLRYPPNEDGFYYLSEATCGGESGCAVGDPNLSCNGYAEGKCGVIFLEDINYGTISVKQAVNLLMVERN